jgi:hypothetical protein
MHKLSDLRKNDIPMTFIKEAWVPKRPENGKKGFAKLKDRIKDAWAVFTCRAEAFMWDEDLK